MNGIAELLKQRPNHLVLGKNQAEREANHTPAFSAEVMNVWIFIFMVLSRRGNFKFPPSDPDPCAMSQNVRRTASSTPQVALTPTDQT
jgi:hypothetical protein